MATQQSESVSPNAIDEVFRLYALVFGQEPPADFAARIRTKFERLQVAGPARDALLPGEGNVSASAEMMEFRAAA